MEHIEKLEAKRTNWFITEENIAIILNKLKTMRDPIVLDIGTHKGYSALKMAQHAKKVITLEADDAWFEEAKESIGEVPNIEMHKGKAQEIIPQLPDKFDLVLIDAQKKEYAEYLKLVLPKMSEGGVIFADNTISHKDMLTDFFIALENKHYKEHNTKKGLIEIT